MDCALCRADCHAGLQAKLGLAWALVTKAAGFKIEPERSDTISE